MKAYEQGITKEQFMEEMKRHKEIDNFISGTYGEGAGTKACAVGCGIQSIVRLKGLDEKSISVNDHAFLGKHLGIPEWLEHVQDTIFEGLSGERQKSWPLKFSEAINTGADLEKAKVPFIIVILESTLQSMASCEFDREKNPDVVKAIDGSMRAIEQMIAAQKSGNEKLISLAAESAALAASAASWSAESAELASASAYEYFADELLDILREIPGAKVEEIK